MPLSWGRRYCVYKYQGFLFYIVTLVLSNVHAFRIGSFLFLPRFSRYRRYRLYPIFSQEYRYGSSHRSLPRRSVPPRKPPGIHVRSPGLGSLRRNDRRSYTDQGTRSHRYIERKFSARRGSRKTFGDFTPLDASHPESEGIRL